MKLRRAFFLLAALAALGPAAGRLLAETPTDTKIRLMSEALAARDAGDFAGAKRKLETLLATAPNDTGVRRLIGEMDARQAAAEAALRAQQEAAAAAPPPAPVPGPAETIPAAAPPATPAPQAAPAIQASAVAPANADVAARTLMSVPVITEGRPAPAAPSNLPEGYAAAMARVEATGVAFARAEGTDRLEKLMTYVQAQRALARLYARDGNYTLAMSTLDAAVASLKTSVGELRDERDEYARKDELEKQGVRLRHKR